jgi:transposase
MPDLARPQKKARREGRTIVFIDESGLSERCPVTTTWAKRGHTPVIQQSFSWSQMSAIAGLSWWRFYFRFFDGAVRSEQVVEFLSALKRQFARKLLVIWDGAAIHRSRIVRAWLERQAGQVIVAALPPYAPELNPVEAIWAYLKKHEIANLCPKDIGEVSDFARQRRLPAEVQCLDHQTERRRGLTAAGVVEVIAWKWRTPSLEDALQPTISQRGSDFIFGQQRDSKPGDGGIDLRR